MRSALIRALRTFAQAFMGVYMAGSFSSSSTLPSFVDLGLLEAATAAGLVATLTFVQNWLESGKYDRG